MFKYFALTASLTLTFLAVTAANFGSANFDQAQFALVAPVAAAPAIPNWKLYKGRGVELMLPDTFKGGDIKKDLGSIAKSLRSMGPDFQQMAQMIEQNPNAFVLFCFDGKVGKSGFLTNVNTTVERVSPAITLDIYLNLLKKNLPKQFRVVESKAISLKNHGKVGQVITEFTIRGISGKQITYVIKHGNNVWVVPYSTGRDEFDRQLPFFKKSIDTFTITSGL